MHLGAYGYIIIFKENIFQVIVNATPSELDDGFFLCPVSGKGDIGIGGGEDGGKLFVFEHMTRQRLLLAA